MHEKLEQLVRRLSIDTQVTTANLKINHLERWLYKTYEPNKFGPEDFWMRLDQWLENVQTDKEKKLLLQLLVEILYLGPIEFEELYRCAYQGPIARWLIDICQIDVFSPNGHEELISAAKQTWFCPITDSFRINSFFHVNNLAAGAKFRPDWHSLFEFADIQKIKDYCADNKIKRLVLLEDFVGGGSQTIDAVEFAVTKIQDLPVLFVPLVICPKGVNAAKQLEAKLCGMNGNINSLRYEAAMELPTDAFITISQNPYGASQSFVDELRSLLNSTYSKVSGNRRPGSKKPYDPFGFPSADPTGGLVVMYSNTPDNTLPIIHWRPPENTWCPIFPRHSRE